MKKLLCFVMIIAALIGCLSFSACGKDGKQAKLCYIDLKNNQTGFTVTGDDTAIAIGVKKGSALTSKINGYLDTFTSTAQNDLMSKMCALVRDKKATYSPDYDLSDNDGGTLKIGMECGYEPYNWTQKTSANGAHPIENVSGKYANGYDVQVAALVAEALNMKIEIYMFEWDSLIPSVTTGTIDLIIAGMSPTDERKEKVDFTTPYYRSNLVVITREDSSIANAKTLAEIDKAGIKIAAQPGTFHLKALQNQTSSLTVVDTLEDFVLMKVALEKGAIDGYIAEEPTAMAFYVSKTGFWDILSTYWPDFLKGMGMTLFISLIATVFGLVIGLLVGVIRTIPLSENKAKRAIQKVIDFILSAYIEIFRGTPMMVQSMVIFWGFAAITSVDVLSQSVINTFAIIIVTINTGAYIAEIVRGGIMSIDKGQFEGAHAIGMGHFKTMFYVIIPQVIKNILPAVANEFVINIKDTSVLNVIGFTELYMFARITVKETGATFETYAIICILYFIMTFTITRILRLIEKKLAGKRNYVLNETPAENKEVEA